MSSMTEPGVRDVRIRNVCMATLRRQLDALLPLATEENELIGLYDMLTDVLPVSMLHVPKPDQEKQTVDERTAAEL